MKGIICYYSGSGNTKLACQYLVKNITAGEFALQDITKAASLDLTQYDVVGFATFADFIGPPQLFQEFIKQLPPQSKRWAFLLNTYGNMNGRTLLTLMELVTKQGFRLLGGHALHMPESYPPLIAAGQGNEKAPSDEELVAFKQFVTELNDTLDKIQKGKEILPPKLSISFGERLLPKTPRTISRHLMGTKFVDETLCTECGLCAKICPYQAITMNPKPVFDKTRCYGCWACYNHCSRKAIYTNKYRGVGHYPKPIDEVKEKLPL